MNWHTQGITTQSIIVSLAFGYGGLVQLLAAMWELAVGNTFGATALGSFGGFWISLAIVLTPGGFQIVEQYPTAEEFGYAFSFFLYGWFIFTFLLWILTLRSTWIFSALFFNTGWTFLMLALSYSYNTAGVPQEGFQKAGGMFGLLAAFLAWYIMLAGLADDSNSFFVVPVFHFPWSERGRENAALGREKSEGTSASSNV